MRKLFFSLKSKQDSEQSAHAQLASKLVIVCHQDDPTCQILSE